MVLIRTDNDLLAQQEFQKSRNQSGCRIVWADWGTRRRNVTPLTQGEPQTLEAQAVLWSRCHLALPDPVAPLVLSWVVELRVCREHRWAGFDHMLQCSGRCGYKTVPGNTIQAFQGS